MSKTDLMYYAEIN